MALIQAYIPAGYSSETKKRFIEGTRAAFIEGFVGCPPPAVSVWVNEYEKEDMCEYAETKKMLVAYTTAGKSAEDKGRFGALFDIMCGEVFGEDKGDTFIIYKEHDMSNLVVRGWLKSDKDMTPPQVGIESK